jgi:hypothetical protein
MAQLFLKIYLGFWALWIAFGVVTNYQEILTKLGYERWTKEQVLLRATDKWKKECGETALSTECPMESSALSIEFVSEAQAEMVTWMFMTAMVKAPFYFLLVLVGLYWLCRGIVAVSKRLKSIFATEDKI